MTIKIDKIVKSRRKTLCLEIGKNGELIIRSPLFVSNKKIQNLIDKKSSWIKSKQQFRKQQLKLKDKFLSSLNTNLKKSEIDKIIRSEVSELAKKYGFSYNKISIGNPKTLWGSCSAKNNLSFSKNIYFLPKKIMQYIIIHELAHTIEKNHSHKFWKIVELIIPDYKNSKKWLRQNSYIIDI